jgi:cytochrome b subunit of formate dehydrogenase
MPVMSASQADVSVGPAQAAAAGCESGRIRRHHLADRLYHWAMAACVLTLLATAFLPIIGYKFEWLGLHWTTGVALTALVAIHIVRAVVWQDFWAMVIDFTDIRNGWRHIVRVLGAGPAPGLPGKYNGLQKLYHTGIAVLVLAIIATGFLMLLKIDTPLWRRDPYRLSNDEWGVVYAVHGFAAMGLITLVMIHIYFAIRPDEWRLTRSMFRGWIWRSEYDQHHDKVRWPAEQG